MNYLRTPILQKIYKRLVLKQQILILSADTDTVSETADTTVDTDLGIGVKRKGRAEKLVKVG